MKLFKRFLSKLLSSPIKLDFEKGGGQKVQELAPLPSSVFWDESVPVHKTPEGLEYVRTPEACFEKIQDYNFTPNYVDIQGLRMHYVDEGPKDGKIVLLLHGQPTWSYLYRKMIPVLAAKGYRCIAPDMIGMGKSDKPIREAYHTYDQHCENQLSFIQTLGLKDINVFVQDWGSLIGLRVVGENPDLFSSLVLANGDLPRYTKGENPFYIPNPLVLNPKVKGLKSALAKHSLAGGQAGFQAWILYCLTNTRTFVGEVMQMMTENDLSAAEVAGYDAPFPSFIYMAGPRTLPSMVAGIQGQQFKALENLAKFEKPFLSLIGLKDRLLGRWSIQKRWIETIPGAKGQEHEQFPDANHFIQDDIGEILADRMHKFLS